MEMSTANMKVAMGVLYGIERTSLRLVMSLWIDF
jgi:hypothetical protein